MSNAVKRRETPRSGLAGLPAEVAKHLAQRLHTRPAPVASRGSSVLKSSR